MDIELDLALEAAKPPVAARTPGLTQAVSDLLAASGPAAPDPAVRRHRPRRRRIRAAAYVFGALAAVGGAAGAHAAGWLLPQPESSWENDSAAVRVDVTLPGGKLCQAVYMAVPAETKATSASPALWEAVWSTARSFLAGVDPTTLTSADSIERYRADALAQHRLAEQTLPADEIPPLPTEAEVRVGAPGAALKSMLDAELRRHDLPTDLLLMTSGDNCAAGARP